jgi:hypothetical protein
MSFFARARAWVGANLVPLALIPLASGLIWVAVWRIWLPPEDGGIVTARTVTTFAANAAAHPTHKVTTVVKTTRGAAPSRRSEALALALVLLGAGAAAVLGVFHDRIGSLELGKDGVKIDLTAAERSGAAALVGRLAGRGASPGSYARGLDRYVRAVASRRPAVVGVSRGRESAGLEDDQASSLADRIADELV